MTAMETMTKNMNNIAFCDRLCKEMWSTTMPQRFQSKCDALGGKVVCMVDDVNDFDNAVAKGLMIDPTPLACQGFDPAAQQT